MEIKRFCIRNWPARSWRPTGPKICSEQAVGPPQSWCGCISNVGRLEMQEKPMFQFKAEGRKYPNGPEVPG